MIWMTYRWNIVHIEAVDSVRSKFIIFLTLKFCSDRVGQTAGAGEQSIQRAQRVHKPKKTVKCAATSDSTVTVTREGNEKIFLRYVNEKKKNFKFRLTGSTDENGWMTRYCLQSSIIVSHHTQCSR